jgi:hypothetical protein
LADFGIAGVVGRTAQIMPTSLKGTSNYMAPEAFEPPFGVEVDIWAMGCLIVEMGPGQPPWAELNMQQIMMAVTVRKKAPGVPDSVPAAETVRKCFSFDPKERPAASALADAFRPQAVEVGASTATAATQTTFSPEPQHRLAALTAELAAQQDEAALRLAESMVRCAELSSQLDALRSENAVLSADLAAEKASAMTFDVRLARVKDDAAHALHRARDEGMRAVAEERGRLREADTRAQEHLQTLQQWQERHEREVTDLHQQLGAATAKALSSQASAKIVKSALVEAEAEADMARALQKEVEERKQALNEQHDPHHEQHKRREATEPAAHQAAEALRRARDEAVRALIEQQDAFEKERAWISELQRGWEAQRSELIARLDAMSSDAAALALSTKAAAAASTDVAAAASTDVAAAASTDAAAAASTDVAAAASTDAAAAHGVSARNRSSGLSLRPVIHNKGSRVPPPARELMLCG